MSIPVGQRCHIRSEILKWLFRAHVIVVVGIIMVADE